MNLQDYESIILRIGDLKLSDTHYTFGEERLLNNITYQPAVKPDDFWHLSIVEHLGRGDYREGVIISNENVKLFLTFGANRLGSNAQSMAIGYQDENAFFFIHEFFGDIYSKKPRLSSRRIIRCQSLFKCKGNIKYVKDVYLFYSPQNNVKISKSDIASFEKLLSIVDELKDAFSEEYLSKLRKRH